MVNKRSAAGSGHHHRRTSMRPEVLCDQSSHTSTKSLAGDILTPHEMIRQRNCKVAEFRHGERYPNIRPPVSTCDPSQTLDWLTKTVDQEGCLVPRQNDEALRVWQMSPNKDTLGYYGVGDPFYAPEAEKFNKTLTSCLKQAVSSRWRVDQEKVPRSPQPVPKKPPQPATVCQPYVLNRQALKAELQRMPTVQQKLKHTEVLSHLFCKKPVDPEDPLGVTETREVVSLRKALDMMRPVEKPKHGLRRKHWYCTPKCDGDVETKCTEYEWAKYKQDTRPYDEAFRRWFLDQAAIQLEREPQDYEELYERFQACFEVKPEPDPDCVALVECCPQTCKEVTEAGGAGPAGPGGPGAPGGRYVPGGFIEGGFEEGIDEAPGGGRPGGHGDGGGDRRPPPLSGVSTPGGATGGAPGGGPGGPTGGAPGGRPGGAPGGGPGGPTGGAPGGTQGGRTPIGTPGGPPGGPAGSTPGGAPGGATGGTPGGAPGGGQGGGQGGPAGGAPGQDKTQEKDKQKDKDQGKVKDKTGGDFSEESYPDEGKGKGKRKDKAKGEREEEAMDEDEETTKGKGKGKGKGKDKAKREREEKAKDEDEDTTKEKGKKKNKNKTPGYDSDPDKPTNEKPPKKLKSPKEPKDFADGTPLPERPPSFMDDEQPQPEQAKQTHREEDSFFTKDVLPPLKKPGPKPAPKPAPKPGQKPGQMPKQPKVPGKKTPGGGKEQAKEKDQGEDQEQEETDKCPPCPPLGCECRICKCLYGKPVPDSPIMQAIMREEKERELREYLRNMRHREYMEGGAPKCQAPLHKVDPISCDDCFCRDPKLTEYCDCLGALQHLQKLLGKHLHPIVNNELIFNLEDLRQRVAQRMCDRIQV